MPCFVVAAVFVFAPSQLQIFSVSQIVVVVVLLACFVFAFAVIFSWPYLVFFVCFRLTGYCFISMTVSVSLFDPL